MVVGVMYCRGIKGEVVVVFVTVASVLWVVLLLCVGVRVLSFIFIVLGLLFL